MVNLSSLFDNNKNYLQLLLLHIGFGISISFFPFISQFVYLSVIAFFFLWIFVKKNSNHEALIAAAYITGSELLFRMTGAATFYESGKYFVILFLFFGMLLSGPSKKSFIYWIYLFLLVPGILFSAMNLNYDSDLRKAIAFNLSGPICLGIVSIYCYFRKVSAERIQTVFLAILFPIISVVAYLYVHTPSIRDSLTSTSSNFAATAGFGPNQVSTIMGLAALLLFMRFFTVRNKLINSIEIFLFVAVAYRGLVTFSRGGMITAGIGIALFLVMYFIYLEASKKIFFIPKFLMIVGILLGTWLFTSVQTGGFIDLRYANKDAAGRLKSDITTGRIDIISSEMDVFFENPISGVGIGKVKEYREEKTGITIASHNEISRLISEHGIFGLIALAILTITPLLYWLMHKRNMYFFSFYIFWIFTISHSSMRLAAPAFIYGLSLIILFHENNPLHRKSIRI